MEDRPSIPVCTIVLQGVPVGLANVFRKWDGKKEITKEGLEVVRVPLNAAVEATGG